MARIISVILIGLNIYETLGTSAVIGNGEVILGVNDFGDLNVPYEAFWDCPSSDPLSVGQIGLRNKDCAYASTEPGCQCEGWGVAIPGLNLDTGAGQDSGGYHNIQSVSFSATSGGSTATVVTQDAGSSPRVQVTHEFGPSASIYAMKVVVTIENIGSDAFDRTIYRRAMDWDITPTHFNEYVTIIDVGGASRASGTLIQSSDDGFCDIDILDNWDCGSIDPACDDVNCVDSGPRDHGAMFDFDLGPLASGESVTFNIFYGTAPGEHKAEMALGAIGAEVYSLGQQSSGTDPEITGLPYTFFFAFSGVGGEAVDPTCDELVPYNVAFIVDESGSVGTTGYTQSIKFVNDLIEDSITADSKIAIWEFSRYVDTIWLFSDTQSPRDDMLTALNTYSFAGSVTDTYAAVLAAVNEYSRANTDGDLAPGNRLLFLLTDGVPVASSGDVCDLKDDLDGLDITVYIIAVGGFSSSSISCLVDDTSTQIITIGDFDDTSFGAVEDELQTVLCPENIVVPEDPLTCAEAQRYCKEVVGTSLASITSDADRTSAIAALDGAGESFGWIGLYSDPVETQWRFRSGSECPSTSAYKCVDFWCTAPGGEDLRPRCIGPTEGGHECAVFYKDPDCVDNDVPIDFPIPFLCDPPTDGTPGTRRRLRHARGSKGYRRR